MSESVGIYSMCSFLLQLNSLTSAPQDPKLNKAKDEQNHSLKGQFIQMAKKHIFSLTPSYLQIASVFHHRGFYLSFLKLFTVICSLISCDLLENVLFYNLFGCTNQKV